MRRTSFLTSFKRREIGERNEQECLGEREEEKREENQPCVEMKGSEPQREGQNLLQIVGGGGVTELLIPSEHLFPLRRRYAGDPP